VGDDDIRRTAEMAAELAVRKYAESEGGRCGLCNESGFAEKHERHHEFIEAAIEFFGRLNDLKWSSIKAVFSFLLVGMVAAFLWFFFGIKTP
jgi:hypothetical protein